MKSNNRKIKYILIVAMFLITIVYAYLTSNLKITGSTKIANDSWNVHFEDIEVSQGSVPIDTSIYSNAQAATINSTDPTKITYNILLDKPGDYYEFTVKVVNSGGIDAMIKSIISTIKIDNGEETEITESSLPSWLEYSVSYDDDVEILGNHLLEAGKYEVYKVKVSYKLDITEEELTESSDKNILMSLNVDYQQSDNIIAVNRKDYTILLDANGGTGSMSSIKCKYDEYCRLTYNSYSLEGKEFKGWATSSNGTVEYNNGVNVINLTKGGTITLYAIWGDIPFRVGDYFTLEADLSTYTIPKEITGYSADQTLSPNELDLWRVIKINGDNTVEAISYYTSSTNVSFNGVTGYANYINTLQIIADQYKKEGYTNSVRMPGYDGQTLIITDTTAFDGTGPRPPSTTQTPSPTSGTGQEYENGIFGDTLYLKDYILLKRLGMLKANKKGESSVTGSYYWLASRIYLYYDSSLDGLTFSFCGRGIVEDRLSYKHCFRDYSANYGMRNSFVFGTEYVRPIITLKDNVKINSGSGTYSSPYTLTN